MCKNIMRKAVILLAVIIIVIVSVLLAKYYRHKFSNMSEGNKELITEEIKENLESSVEPETEIVSTTKCSIVCTDYTETKCETYYNNVVFYDVPLSKDTQSFVCEVCDYYGFDAKLIYQIIKVESNYKSNLVSKTNDHGIMQLNARWYSGYLSANDGFNYVLDNFNIYNDKQNILIGIRELAYWKSVCANRGYYDTSSILECYNRGFEYFNNTEKKVYSAKVLSVEVNKI